MKELNISKQEALALIEKTRRSINALDMFRSQRHQDRIFLSPARELLVRGGNRSGKSTCCAVLFSAIAMDKKITLSDGTKVDARRPHQKGRPLRMWVIGFDGRHIGETIHRLLFKAGLFKVIKDKHTGLWRAYDQTNPEDLERKNEAKPSPPLIPARYIVPKSWCYENAANNEFKKVSIRDPVTKELLADIYAYSSGAEAKAGDPVDVIFIDEAIKNPEHYSEWSARLVDLLGRAFWSSWPVASCKPLRRLTERAKEDETHEMAEEVILPTSSNMQVDAKGVAQLLASLTEEERVARDKGEYMLDGLLAYPLFSTAIHCAYQRCSTCMHNDRAECGCKDGDDELAKILRANRGQIPDDWTRELSLDPGTSNPAVLFCAIPPPSFGDYLVIYDELYPGRKDAEQLAALVKQKVGRHKFNRFIIDYRAGRQTPMSYNMSVRDNYQKAFKSAGLKCFQTGPTFSYGNDNPSVRMMEIQRLMHLNESGRPSLRIVTHNCVNLCKQLSDAMKDESHGIVAEDKLASGQKLDLHDCLGYFVCSKPMYVKPQPPISEANLIALQAARYRGRVSTETPAWGSFY